MNGLSEFEMEVLASLPIEPTGFSLAELANDLLNDRSPAAKGKVRRALEDIAQALGGLYVNSGNDDFGGAGVRMYGVPRAKRAAVGQFLAGKGLIHV